MSVVVKGMKMPESCDACMFSDWSNLSQTASCKLKEYEPCFADFSNEYRSKRADFCPLIALPDKHGRLVDADELIHELNNSHYPGAPYVDAGISVAIGKVCDAPTIVEKEDSNDS